MKRFLLVALLCASPFGVAVTAHADDPYYPPPNPQCTINLQGNCIGDCINQFGRCILMYDAGSNTYFCKCQA